MAAHLDDVMDQAAIAANAQRDEEAGVPLPADTAREEANAADEADADGDEDVADDEGEGEDTAPPTAPPSTAPAEPTTSETPPTTEAPRYTRREAQRRALERDTFERQAAEARQIASRAEAELQASRTADQTILNALAEISGYTREANNRTRYENLRDKVIEGTATEEEHQLVTEMTQWHKLAGPIYRAAESQVTNAFAVDWNGLKDLEGVGEAGFTKLNQAANGVAGARELHAMAYAAGTAKAKAESDATIARLKAELKSLKNGKVADLPQPAAAGGGAVPSGNGWQARAIDPKTGFTTDEFDREVRAGKWLGVDLSKTN